jgi:hypothetical protein
MNRLHLLIGEAKNTLKGLVNSIVFVEVKVAMHVLQHNLIDAVVTAEDIEVVRPIDVNSAQKVKLSRDIAVQGDLGDGSKGVVALSRHDWRFDDQIRKWNRQFFIFESIF